MLSRGLSLFLLALLLAVDPAAAGNNYYNKYYNKNDDGNGGGNADDDLVDLSNEDFDAVSLMPVSCVNYMNGHMIKFEMFENNNNFQCHTNNLGTFVVSISHYMRAYFNYQALIRGENFRLPSDAGYLNCVLLQQTAYSDEKLYAKIGCQERDTYTSTKLKIHVYTDKQCSEPYDDGQSSNTRTRKGYNINGYYFSSKVSFRPPFYSCMTCKPSEISSSFSKRKTFWYDDDAASNGYQIYKYFDDWLDDYFLNDDAYFTVQQYANNERVNEKDDDDDFYTIDDDGRRVLLESPEEAETASRSRNAKVPSRNVPKYDEEEHGNLVGSSIREFIAEDGLLESFEKEFWKEHAEIRELGNGNSNSYNDDSVYTWNMCTKVYKYGVWCDQDCRDLDAFRIDEWSKSDVFLLIVMGVFMGFMMLLVFAKRVKAYEKASIYGEEMLADVGMSPSVMAALFGLIFAIIIILAFLRFVNETLVFAVVFCILLFIYMLKLTLFETKSSALLGSKKSRRNKKDPYSFQDDFGYDGGNPLFKY
jgi:hypothetical protein